MKPVQSGLPIGIFDSGVGGLTVAAAIQARLPQESMLYFGDTARCPYGDKSPQEVLAFSIQICDFLVEQGIKMLVVACNTATAVALPTLQKRYSVPVIGVVEPGASAAANLAKVGRIGVIGTAVTIASGAYERAVKALRSEAEVLSLACPRFVPLVERGETTGPMVEQIVRESLQPLEKQNLDLLILGCTHYPLLQDTIHKVMGPEVTLISSAERTAMQVASELSLEGMAVTTQAGRRQTFFTTGDGRRMQSFVAQWLGISEADADVRSVNPLSIQAVGSHFAL
ncbi:glutamate racemase [Alicyclobacillus curvatus]|jgi:glutamate racemase|nr:glutamate racemase [Alicyclobacillus curvatus]